MMKQCKGLFVLTGFLLFSLIIVAPNTALAAAADGKQYVIKVTTDGSETNTKTIGLRKWAQDVEKASNGRLKLELYIGAQLYNDRDAMVAVSMGNVDVCLPPLATASGIDRNGQIMELPTFYGVTFDQYKKLVNGKFGEALAKKFEAKLNVKVLGYWNNGNYVYGSNKKMIKTPDDFIGQKIRIMGGPLSEACMKTFGGAPVTIAWSETYAAMQQRVADGAETTMVGVNSIKMWEVCKYITFSKHVLSSNIFMMNKNTWNNLPADLQQILSDTWKEAQYYQDEVVTPEKEEEGVKAIKAGGGEVYELSQKELQAFKVKILPLEEKFIKSLGFDQNLVKLAKSELGFE